MSEDAKTPSSGDRESTPRPPSTPSDEGESIYSGVSYIEPDEADGSDGASILSAYDENGNPLFEFVEELGRLYLSSIGDDSAYLLPHDARERDRLNLQHDIFKALTSRDFHAPVKNPLRILDIGTGTGSWCCEIAQTFPHAQVTGTDICPLPDRIGVPGNVRFMKEDATQNDWGPDPYSYIHTRMMLGCFENFKPIIRRSYDYLEPGGWFESQELYPKLFCDDGTVTQDNPFLKWTRLQDEAAMKLYRPLRIGNKLKTWYEEAGFINVHEEVYKLPINGWPKDPRLKVIGKAWAYQLQTGLSAFSLRFFNLAFGWDLTQTEVEIVPAKAAIMDRNVHGFHKIYIVWGQKPENAPMKELP